MFTHWNSLDRKFSTLDELTRHFSRLCNDVQVSDSVNCGVNDARVQEGDEGYTLSMDMPGVDSENLKVRFENQVLTIEGNRSDRKKSYNRSYKLSNAVDADKLEASLTNGVLTITLPKTESSKGRDIPVTIS
jgi:HSP20 family protein